MVKSYLIFAIIAAVLCLLLAQSDAFSVELFEQKHFKGRSTTIDVNRGCTDIEDEWDDLASSILPKDCIIIYKHPDCQGPRVRLEPYTFGSAYLREINFEDKISSISPCNFQSTPNK
ncbi:unnamed protein product [Orchesella dallaii]|uniref:Uncharacterized protein n=1 Tax=Orchesella dallaii TaxID=48710 RepID=A0ABP1QV18_9HEXA